MPEHPRIDDLRRRVQKDPASIAFAQLAEEYRRAGDYQEAVNVCRAGLAIHPGYLSARVTLGRALVELHQLDAARAEFEIVLKSAPENLAAIRGLAEALHKGGSLPEALAQFRAALALAPNDPDLDQTVADLTRELAPKRPVRPADGLSFEQARSELLAHPQAQTPAGSAPSPQPAPAAVAPAHTTQAAAAAAPPPVAPAVVIPARPAPERVEQHTIEALEQWLDAIHVARSDRNP